MHHRCLEENTTEEKTGEHDQTKSPDRDLELEWISVAWKLPQEPDCNQREHGGQRTERIEGIGGIRPGADDSGT
jgi:hypothetical protein